MINKGLLLIYCQKGVHSNPYAANVLGMASTMQGAVKIFFVVFGVSLFALAENQECYTENIKYDHIQKSGLLESYENKKTVKVSCAIGYVGFLKLECDNGIWTKVAERECKRKPCGHPGDTPNGDFKLTKELEFVFGATVEYSCRKGYVMASRINYRNCQSHGWDNAVPLCEVVKCPSISNFDDVIATGNTEEASYGDVIHFECKSPQKMLSGPEDIHCKDNGQWSGSIPKCIEITCRAPEIPNGFTNLDREYKENNVLQYVCKEGYKAKSGAHRCTKHGWSIKPECEEIICVLGAATKGTERTNPIGQNIFKIGEDVELICSRTYWVFGTKQKSRIVKCLDDGTWERRPVCEEMTCEYPHGEQLSYTRPHLRQNYKLLDKMQYSCKQGYQGQSSYATCTENGWDPNPLCIEITCQKPEVARGQVMGTQKDTYKQGEPIMIKCDPGYEPESFWVTCVQNRIWDNMQHCTLKKATCQETSVEGVVKHELAEKYFYSCGPGYKLFDEKWWGVVNCLDGQWSYTPLCIFDNQCGQISNADAKHFQERKGYNHEDTIEFEYNLKPWCYKCVNGKWEDCESKRCGTPPRVENGVITSYSQQQVEYICRKNYNLIGEKIIFCTDSQWKKPPACQFGEILRCPEPDRQINNATLIRANLKAYYQEGGTVEYRCKTGFDFQNGAQATCSQGKWNYPQCIQSLSSLNTDQEEKNETVSSEDFSFHTNVTAGQNGSQSEVDEKLTCSDPEQKINNATLQSRWKEFYEEGDTVEYQCQKNFHFQNGSKATCSKGEWNYPQCIPKNSCPSPPTISNGEVDKNYRKNEYKNSDHVIYVCYPSYTLVGNKKTCSQGRWVGQVRCNKN